MGDHKTQIVAKGSLKNGNYIYIFSIFILSNFSSLPPLKICTTKSVYKQLTSENEPVCGVQRYIIH